MLLKDIEQFIFICILCFKDLIDSHYRLEYNSYILYCIKLYICAEFGPLNELHILAIYSTFTILPFQIHWTHQVSKCKFVDSTC